MEATIMLDHGMTFHGSSNSGYTLKMDSDSSVGGDNSGFRPMELLLIGLGGCTAMDVLSILRKKRQDVRGYRIEVGGTQMDGHPNAFTRMDVTHVLEGGDLDVDAVRRAIELSATKYCAVGATLASGITEIHHGYRVIDVVTGAEKTGDVLVEGPHQDPTAAAVAAS